jgi:hypothetical protein
MKKLVLSVIILGGLFGGSAMAANPDIFARNAIYVGGKLVSANKMNEGAKFATPTAPLTVSAADSYYQQDGKYYFKVSYFLNIRREKEALSTVLFYNTISKGPGQNLVQQVKPKPDDNNIVGYTNGVWTIVMRGSLILEEGTSNISLKLDSGGNIAESDEQNNIYNFKVTFKK